MARRSGNPRGAATRKTTPAEQRHHGTVIANYGKLLAVETADQGVIRVLPLRQIGYAACGDQVVYEYRDKRQAVAIERLPRHTSMERIDNRGRVRILASEFDNLLVVAADPPGFDRRLIDQYLVMAGHLRVAAMLVFNKCDAWSEATRREADALETLYAGLGYPVIACSCRTGEGFGTLQQVLRDHVSILVGQSGVGKSSISGRLLPDREIRVGAVSEATGLGSHTTTTTMLYRLPDGGSIIDSPGVREFALDHLDAADVDRGFLEISNIGGRCRFRNCRHDQETGCAVRTAVEAGEIDASRYRHYLEFMAAAGSMTDRRGD